MKGQES